MSVQEGEISNVQVHVRPLPYDIEPQELDDVFAAIGPIKPVKILQGYAFVEFEQPEDAQTAVNTLDGAERFGAPIEVQFAKHKELKPSTRGLHRALVQNLPETAAWQELKDHVKDVSGILATFVRVDFDHVGHLEFGSQEELEDAIAKISGSVLDGSTLEAEVDTSEYVPPPPRRFRGGFRGGPRGGFRGGFRGGPRGERGGFRGGPPPRGFRDYRDRERDDYYRGPPPPRGGGFRGGPPPPRGYGNGGDHYERDSYDRGIDRYERGDRYERRDRSPGRY